MIINGYDSLHNRVLKIQNRIDTLANCEYKSSDWFYKVIECEVDLAVCVVGYANYFERNQYPHSKRLGKTITKAELSSFMPDLKSAFAHMDSLYESSILSREGEGLLGGMAEFFDDFRKTGRAGEYEIPNNRSLALTKKELVCKTLQLGFDYYILGSYSNNTVNELKKLNDIYGGSRQFSRNFDHLLLPFKNVADRFQKVKR